MMKTTWALEPGRLGFETIWVIFLSYGFLIFLLVCFLSSPEDMLTDFRERVRKVERGEKST